MLQKVINCYQCCWWWKA